jgi:hypothetical protein
MPRCLAARTVPLGFSLGKWVSRSQNRFDRHCVSSPKRSTGSHRLVSEIPMFGPSRPRYRTVSRTHASAGLPRARLLSIPDAHATAAPPDPATAKQSPGEV